MMEIDDFAMEQVSKGLTGLCNLICTSAPAHGPMVKDIIGSWLVLYANVEASLHGADKSHYERVVATYKELCRGRYTILGEV